jgi:hypothetical protein
MKRTLAHTIIGGILVLLAGTSAFAEGFSLETGVGSLGMDILGANYATAANAATWLPSVDPYVNFAYSLKLDPANTLVLGCNIDDNIVFLSAKKNSATKLAVPGDASTYTKYASTGADGVTAQSLRLNPGVSYKTGGLSAGLSFPIFLNFASSANTADAALAVLPKGISYLAKWMANKSANTTSAGNTTVPYDGVNSNLFTANAKIAYKIPLGDGMALIPAVESDLSISPLWWVDLFANLSLLTGPLSTDLKLSLYNTPNDPNNLDGVANGALLYWYLDPKLTLDFATLGIKGLKLWLAASIPVTGNTNAAGQATTLYGAFIAPGISYANSGFYVEFTSKLNNIDQGLTGSTSSTPAFSSRFQWDPALKVSYAFSF